MKINGPNELAKLAEAKRKKRKDGVSDTDAAAFAALLGGTGEADATDAPSQVDLPQGLLGLQEVDSHELEQKKAKKRGSQLLDSLDDIRHSLLTGMLSREQILQLRRTLDAEKLQISDPKLKSILQEIEVRAAVELAKWEQNKY